MKTIGLIGGITYLSTLDYYRFLNEMVNESLGGVEAGQIIVYSVNFGVIKKLTENDDWSGLAEHMRFAAQKLVAAGADCILIGANTMHKIADEVQKDLGVPVIHVAEQVALAIRKQHISKVALLGTKYTMQLSFYKDKLAEQGIEAIIPNSSEIEEMNYAIYNEMGKGIFLPERKTMFLNIIDRLIDQGAGGIILGCTEIPILIKQEDCPVPVFDSTRIHSRAAVDFALS